MYGFEAIAGTVTEFQITYTDDKGDTAVYVWTVEVEGIPIPKDITEPTEGGGDGQLGPDELTPELQVTIQPLKPSREQVFLREWSETSQYGYLLSGQVYASTEEEAAALAEEIPFAVPYVSGFDSRGNMEIRFNHNVLLRDNLKEIVDAGLIEFTLINDLVDMPVGGSAVQPDYLDLSQIIDDYKASAGDTGFEPTEQPQQPPSS